MRSVRNRCLNLIAHKSVKERVAKLLLDDADVVADEVGVSKVTVFNHLSKAMDWIKEQFK